jgi:hypothetical protein
MITFLPLKLLTGILETMCMMLEAFKSSEQKCNHPESKGGDALSSCYVLKPFQRWSFNPVTIELKIK